MGDANIVLPYNRHIMSDKVCTICIPQSEASAYDMNNVKHHVGCPVYMRETELEWQALCIQRSNPAPVCRKCGYKNFEYLPVGNKFYPWYCQRCHENSEYPYGANVGDPVIEKENQINNLKWQVHAETSMSQIMLWIIMWKLFGGIVGFLAVLFIGGNLYTLFKSISKLPKNYFKL